MADALLAFLQGPHTTASALIAEETRLAGVPPLNSSLLAGLRSGALLILVGGFEQFVNHLLREKVLRLEHHLPKPPLRTLTDKIARQGIRLAANYLERVALDRKLAPAIAQAHATRATLLLSSGNLVSAAYGLERTNPNPTNVAKAFEQIGLDNVLQRTNTKRLFEVAFGAPVTPTFIPDKLAEIVRKRHLAAHTGSDGSTSGADLLAYATFLVALSSALDEVLDDWVSALVASCT